MKTSRTRLVVAVVAILVMAAVDMRANGAAVDAIANGKALYESAEYERALEVLKEIDAASSPLEQMREAAVYRGLCLLALNRGADAEDAIQQLLERDPFYVPGADITPRIRDIVNGVRERIRPALVREHYRTGKQQFDGGNAAAALEEFRVVLRLVDEAPEGEVKASFDDVRILASGFRELAGRARPADLSRVVEPRQADKRDSAALGPAIVPPTTIRQTLPRLSSAAITALRGAVGVAGRIEVVIDEKGNVTSAKLLKSAYLPYDAELLAAARGWKYTPATSNGVPVPFVKQVDFVFDLSK